jgi:hypothetical protein
MALTQCRECEREISDQAFSCPHCGAPRPAQKKWQGTGVDWKSGASFWGFPLVHVAYGRDAHGRLRVAKGIVAIGQFAIGLVTIAQFGIGILFGFGQFMAGLIAIAQFAGGVVFGVGQVATGYAAIGQIVLAYYGIGQLGWAKFMWSPERKDMEAVAFFHTLLERVKLFFDR